MDLFTYLMAKNDHNTSVKKDLFSYLLGKNQSGTYTDYSGTSLSINNTKKGKMAITLKGNTSQTGTPTPDNPIPVNVVSGDNEVVVSNSDNTQSQTYPINLPVENLFDLSNYNNLSQNDIVATINTDTGEITLNGTSTATAYLRFDLHSTIPSGTIVSYSANNSSTIAGVYLNLALDGSTKQVLQLNSQNAKNQNITLDTNINRVYIQVNNGITLNNFVIKPQLEKGSKANHYTPYGTTPIELNKIGTSQDYITKNSGKQLFNPSLIDEYTTSTGITISHNSSGEIVLNGTASSQTNINTPHLNIPTGTTQISISGGTSSVSYAYNTYTSDDTYIGVSRDSGTPQTYTLPSNASKYEINIRIASGTTLNNYVVRAMFNNGTPLPYEPYGTGQWCKYNAIEKVVLDGSENWSNYSYAFQTNDYKSSTSAGMCDYFLYSNSWSSTSETYRGKFNLNSTTLRFMPTDTTIDEVSEWETWLNTHNTTVYYVLDSPYLSLIEDNNLIEQLNEIEKAQSYNGQTNINQVNNDLPFELDVSVKIKV